MQLQLMARHDVEELEPQITISTDPISDMCSGWSSGPYLLLAVHFFHDVSQYDLQDAMALSGSRSSDIWFPVPLYD